MEGKLLNEDFLNSIIKSHINLALNDFVSNLHNDLSTVSSLGDFLLEREDVAKILKISVRQVDNLKSKGKLKPCLIGKSVRFKNSVVQDYIKSLC